MEGGSTVVDVLRHQAETRPDERAFAIDGSSLSWSTLESDVRGLSAGLLRSGMQRGDVVALNLPLGLELVTAIFAVEWIGAVPLVLDPTMPASTAERRLAEAGCRRVVDDVANLRASPGDARADPVATPNDIAYLQPTSGSTGEPRLAALSHRSLLAQLGGLRTVFGDDHVFVGWMPLFHDMGLVGSVFLPAYLGCPSYLLRPALANLGRWLATIAEVGGTFTASTDFGYRVAAKLARASSDLTTLRVAVNGGEPVRQSTISAFEDRFGLGPVMRPAYGLAEAVCAVTVAVPGEERRVDADGRVSCGPAIPGVEVDIRAGGDIWVRGATVFDGYWGDSAETAGVLVGGWLRTGDVGSLDDDGHLYVAGRTRAMINRAGHLIPAGAVEEVVDALEGVRRSAAVGVSTRAASEALVVVVEARTAGDDASTIERAAAHAVRGALGFLPSRVLVVRRGTIPLTANGKVRYGELRHTIEAGELDS